MSLWDELGAPPNGGERLVHVRFGAGRNVFAVRPSQHGGHFGCVGQQAGRSRLAQNPFEPDFRQAALLLRIAATDIAMHAREPNLLDVSWSPGCGRTPEIWSEESASFVDRDRVTANLNIRVVCGVG